LRTMRLEYQTPMAGNKGQRKHKIQPRNALESESSFDRKRLPTAQDGKSGRKAPVGVALIELISRRGGPTARLEPNGYQTHNTQKRHLDRGNYRRDEKRLEAPTTNEHRRHQGSVSRTSRNHLRGRDDGIHQLVNCKTGRA